MNEAESIGIGGGILFGKGAERVAEVADVTESFELFHFSLFFFICK